MAAEEDDGGVPVETNEEGGGDGGPPAETANEEVDGEAPAETSAFGNLEAEDRAGLMALYEATGGTEWKVSERWGEEGVSPQRWSGVTVEIVDESFGGNPMVSGVCIRRRRARTAHKTSTLPSPRSLITRRPQDRWPGSTCIRTDWSVRSRRPSWPAQ